MVTESAQQNLNTLEIQDGSRSKLPTINKRHLAVTVILGTLVLGLVILGTVLLSGESVQQSGVASSAAAQRRDIRGIELEQILSGTFAPKRFNATFISGTEVLYKNDEGDIVIYNFEGNYTQVILSESSPILESAVAYTLSNDRKYLLVAHTFQKLYRYSFIAHYEIYDLSTKKNFPLVTPEGYRLHLVAEWAPAGSGLAFVSHSNHDIYYKSSANAVARRLTANGVPGVVFNGVPDWVNEEEVFSNNLALWFSPDGRQLAFARFNDSQTRVMSFPFYGYPGRLEFQYTRAVNIRYPKPGTPNPKVSLHVANLENAEPLELVPPSELINSEPILFAVSWILEQKEKRGWITNAGAPLFSKSGSEMALILPQKQQDGKEFRHVCLGTLGTNNEYKIRALTNGTKTVTELLKFDENAQKIFFLATEEGHPERLHLYEVTTGNSETRCITCQLKTKLQKKPCYYNSASFSASSYALQCGGPGVPEITIRDFNHNELLNWEDNREIFEDVRNRQWPIIERINVSVPGGFQAQATLLLPPDIDRNRIRGYPLIVHVYGGPDSVQASDRFTVDWSTYLTVNKSFVYATIDGRGSGNKGNDMLFSIFHQLGTYEVQDQINITRYLLDNFAYLDPARTAIWGWSYGGYATAMALIQDVKNVFRCGISVAPVTDWVYYDTIYTERYMGLPTPLDNIQGYANAQLNDKVENLRKKKYFLIHGTLDDNVHYQQSMMLAKVLEQSDILFREQSYPDEEHGLTGVRHHLYHSMEAFLDDCFLK